MSYRELMTLFGRLRDLPAPDRTLIFLQLLNEPIVGVYLHNNLSYDLPAPLDHGECGLIVHIPTLDEIRDNQSDRPRNPRHTMNQHLHIAFIVRWFSPHATQ